MSVMVMVGLLCPSVLMHHLPTATVCPWVFGVSTAVVAAYLVDLGLAFAQHPNQLRSGFSSGVLLDALMIGCLVLEMLLLAMPALRCPSQIFEMIVECKVICVCPRLLGLYNLCCTSGRAVGCPHRKDVDSLSTKTVVLSALAVLLLSNLEPVLWSQGRDAAKLAEAVLANYSTQIGSAHILETLSTVFGSRLTYVEVAGASLVGDPSVVPSVYHSICTTDTDGHATVCIKRANMHNQALYLCRIVAVIFVVACGTQYLVMQIHAMLALSTVPTISNLDPIRNMVWQAPEDAAASPEQPDGGAFDPAVFGPVSPSPSSQPSHAPPVTDSNVQGFFLNAMSHELRTPFTVALNNAELLLELEPETPHRELLQGIIAGSSRGLTTVSHIITYTELQSGQVEVQQEQFDVCELVRATIRSVMVEFRQKHLHFHMATGLSDYIGDARKLQQILLQVLHNAILHNPEDNAITVVVSLATRRNLQDRWQDVYTVEHGTDRLCPLLIEVTDQGVGMPQDFDIKEAVFSPFNSISNKSTRNTQQGCGLGLYNSKRLAELLGGSIKVTSPATLDPRALPNLKSPFNGSIITTNASIPNSSQPDSPSSSTTTQKAKGKQASRPGTRISILVPSKPVLQADSPDSFPITSGTTGRNYSSDSDWSVGSRMTAKRREKGHEASVHSFTCVPTSEATGKMDSVQEPGTDPLNTHIKPDDRAFPVLVVEDTPIAARSLSAQLQHLGCRVVICENGQRVLDHFDANPGAWYPLIIMDYHMPIMDGIQCTGAIRRLEREGGFPGRPAMYILGLSGDDVEGTSRACVAAGMDSFSSKPLPIAGLRTVVEGRKLAWEGGCN